MARDYFDMTVDQKLEFLRKRVKEKDAKERLAVEKLYKINKKEREEHQEKTDAILATLPKSPVPEGADDWTFQEKLAYINQPLAAETQAVLDKSRQALEALFDKQEERERRESIDLYSYEEEIEKKKKRVSWLFAQNTSELVEKILKAEDNNGYYREIISDVEAAHSRKERRLENKIKALTAALKQQKTEFIAGAIIVTVLLFSLI